ncbi:hypothetical protein [Flavobacterium sp. UMI-01]|uniref:hypothetical protein n=1 Tax=Flavobacterium sp. UMI-01 TaxID=1441053 RepID=UPI001C7D8677|nr:hypothetical protein [Flavobacterium sp. UMI-01]GIZ08053.1 hypothetical protein FUMI01_07800 [Flavobacterium sp. UMI-01]
MRISTTVLGIFLSMAMHAQTHQIEKHNGQKIDVNFIKFQNNLLLYSPVGSTVEYKISKYAVAYLHDKKTSHSEMITPKVMLNSKKDFEKVTVIEPEHSIGLDSKKELVVYEGINKGGTNFFINEQSIRKIKYKVAEMGFPFVVIVDKNNGKFRVIAYNY